MQIVVPCGAVEVVALPLLRDYGGDEDGRNRHNGHELPDKRE